MVRTQLTTLLMCIIEIAVMLEARNWSELHFYGDPFRLHRLNATRYLVMGYDESFLCTELRDTHKAMEAHCVPFNNARYIIDSVMTEEGELVILGGLPNDLRAKHSGNISMFVAKFDSYRLDQVWMKSYFYSSNFSYSETRLRVSKRKNPTRTTYWFDLKGPMSYDFTILEIDGSGGDVVWEKEFMHSLAVFGDTKGGDIVYTAYVYNESVGYDDFRIFSLDSDRNLRSSIDLNITVVVHKMIETNDGFVIFGWNKYAGNNDFFSKIMS